MIHPDPEPPRPDAARWLRVKDVFHAALDRPPAARAEYLGRECGGDLDLRREVESLLAAHGEAGEFLSQPASYDASPDLAGRRIGAYRILDEVGRGGMGFVYRAVRDDDVFEKMVALKLVRGGASPEHLRRLESERRILARLQHPNIASILDGGATDEGQPYLVMEYVSGEPIDAHCDGKGLGARARLELFRTVCGAVHYAHQNLVVHRDLKPANILITPDGRPKLLDFGIAKLLAAGVEPDEAPTATLLPMMTPDYASPEQVRGRAVTTASDVYSLGVLLYELLTGQRPFTVRTGSLEEIVRSVCDTEPLAPSEARLPAGTTPTRPWVARRELKGDLDTIVLKALRKEPERRYLSAQELSDDVRRYLEGLPVLARRDTLGYRTSKFVSRNRAGVTAAALVVASLAGGMVMTIRQARIAEANRQRAERRFAEVRSLAAFVIGDMHDAIVRLPGSTPARKKLVAKALEYLDGLASESVSDPVLRAEIAQGYQRLAEVQGRRGVANLGDSAGALSSVRKAVGLREQLAAAAPADATTLTRLATSYSVLANLLVDEGRTAEAWVVLDRAKAALDAIPPLQGGEMIALLAWENYHDDLAGRAKLEGNLPAMREARRRQVEVAEKMVAQEPGSDTWRELALARKYHGAALHALGERKLAREEYDQALALDRRDVDAEPSKPQYRLDLSFSLASIGSLLRDEGDLKGALPKYREAVALRQEVYAADRDNEFAYGSVVRGHQSLADVLTQMGDRTAAAREEREAQAIRSEWEKRHPAGH